MKHTKLGILAAKQLRCQAWEKWRAEGEENKAGYTGENRKGINAAEREWEARPINVRKIESKSSEQRRLQNRKVKHVNKDRDEESRRQLGWVASGKEEGDRKNITFHTGRLKSDCIASVHWLQYIPPILYRRLGSLATAV